MKSVRESHSLRFIMTRVWGVLRASGGREMSKPFCSARMVQQAWDEIQCVLAAIIPSPDPRIHFVSGEACRVR